ncbi:MAG TPA: amidase [Bryobacteraceae bacterium]|jgi:amidase|nr:amidase [Bryobacteraceae bacterium]
MNRRKFLTTTALASALAARAQEPKPPMQEPSHADTQHAPGVGLRSFELDELTVSELAGRMKQGALTAERIAQLYLERIDEIDRRGPALRSVIEINPDALAIAKGLDEEYKAKGPRGPLHGIPVLLKDNIETGDKMQTTAGSMALAGTPAAKDAWVAERLRAAGAVILGKTNLSEWANFRSTHSTSGWSGRGGQTKNPYALDRNPCGSSSGSGAAISANLCALAVGSETDGSVVCPSSMCGIVGIKPTLGLISRAGIVPIAHSQDTAGPMARTVRDAALLLGAMTGVDSRDNSTHASAGKSNTDYTQFLDANGLRGARFGIARQYFNIGPAVTAVMEECIGLLRSAGAEIVDPADLPTFEAWRDTETQVLLYEFKADLNAYLAERRTGVRSLADCIAFNRAYRAKEMPYFEQELFEQAQEKGPLTEKGYKDALAANHRLARKEGIDAVIAKHKVDAIVGPTAGPAWLTDWVAGDRADSGCASPPAVAGYPHITVPAGFKFGLPLGISFFGPAWSEPKLIKFAYAFEQARKARRKPEFLPDVNFYA